MGDSKIHPLVAARLSVALRAVRDTASALGDVVLPRTCAVCGCRLDVGERHICTDCAADFPLTYYWDMPYNPAADRLNEIIQHKFDTLTPEPGNGQEEAGLGIRREEVELGGEPEEAGLGIRREEVELGGGGESRPAGRPQYEPYARFAALFFYNSDNGYRHICHRLKYGGDTAIGRHFGRELGRRIASAPQFADVDLVTPVPLHWTRRWKRGYNQAAVIAAEVAGQLGALHCPDLLRRLRRTVTQTVLSVEEKKRNVKGAFAVDPARLHRLVSRMEATPPVSRPDPADSSATADTSAATIHSGPADTSATTDPAAGTRQWRPRHILVIDDVMTTGATLAACHSALREVFPPPVRISAAALACVEIK